MAYYDRDKQLSLLSNVDLGIDTAKQTLERTSLTAKINKAVTKWKKENLGTTIIEEYVFTLLDHAKNELIYSLLGIKEDWSGGFEIDRVNGRHSPLSTDIEDQAERAAREWVQMAFATAPKPNQAQINAIKKYYKEVFERAVTRNVDQIAENDARKFLNETIGLIVAEREDDESSVPFPREEEDE